MKKKVLKAYIPYNSNYLASWKRQTVETVKRSVLVRGGGEIWKEKEFE